MGDWKSILKADSVNWLLEEDNPSVRYFTLTEILDKPITDSEVKKAKNAIMNSGVVPRILAKQNADGYWETPTAFYTAKYKGTSWQLIILAELGADEKDTCIRKACEFILANSQNPESNGFSMHLSIKAGGGLRSEVIPCLTGNMVWSLIRLGYLEDPRVQRGIIWITTYQRFDDGVKEAQKGWPYDKYVMCWGKYTCPYRAIKILSVLVVHCLFLFFVFTSVL